MFFRNLHLNNSRIERKRNHKIPNVCDIFYAWSIEQNWSTQHWTLKKKQSYNDIITNEPIKNVNGCQQPWPDIAKNNFNFGAIFSPWINDNDSTIHFTFSQLLYEHFVFSRLQTTIIIWLSNLKRSFTRGKEKKWELWFNKVHKIYWLDGLINKSFGENHLI